MASSIFAVAAMSLWGLRSAGAVDCRSMIRLEVGSIYYYEGLPIVAIRLTNTADRRLLFCRPMDPIPGTNLCYEVRPLDDSSSVSQPAISCPRTFALDPRHHAVAEVANPYGTQDLVVTFAFCKTWTCDTCLVSIDVRDFASRLDPTAISREEAVKAAEEAGFPFQLDPKWSATLKWFQPVGRVWEIRARLKEDDTSKVRTDTLAFVDAYSCGFLPETWLCTIKMKEMTVP
jgi:hypothetical protein